MKLAVFILLIVYITFPIKATTPERKTDEIDLQLRLAPPQNKLNNEKVNENVSKEDERREKRRIGMKRKRQAIKEQGGEVLIAAKKKQKDYDKKFLKDLYADPKKHSAYKARRRAWFKANRAKKRLQKEQSQNDELDLELKLGPNDSSKGSHTTNDKHDVVPQAGQRQKRYNATRLTLGTNMNLAQQAYQDATHSLTKMERYELRLEKKRLYMREKKRKLEGMGSEMVKLALERKRENQQRYIEKLKSDPKSRAKYLQKKAEANKEARKQKKGIKEAERRS